MTSNALYITAENSAKIKAVRRRQEIVSKGIIYALLISGTLIFVLPLVIMVSTSLKSFNEINHYPPTFLPNVVITSNYAEAWNYKNTQFPRWTFNTIFIIAATLPGVLITSSLCAYGFARLKFPGRNLWFILTLASIMLPPQVTLIPLYILFYKLGWLNTFNPLIIPAWFGGGALNIFLLRQFFMQIRANWMKRRSLMERDTLESGGVSTYRWRALR